MDFKKFIEDVEKCKFQVLDHSLAVNEKINDGYTTIPLESYQSILNFIIESLIETEDVVTALFNDNNMKSKRIDELLSFIK